jgi:hypothetical protein
MRFNELLIIFFMLSELTKLRQLYKYNSRESLELHTLVAGLLDPSAVTIENVNVPENINDNGISDNQLKRILEAFLRVCKFYKKPKVSDEEITPSLQDLGNVCQTIENFEKCRLHCIVAVQRSYKLYDRYVEYVGDPVKFRRKDSNNEINFAKYKSREKFLEKFIECSAK